jgi:uncharacterized protein with PIN domain
VTAAQTPQRFTLDEAIVDSSALMCILMGEPAAPLFMAALQKTTRLYIGAATRAEVWLAAFNLFSSVGSMQNHVSVYFVKVF